MATSMYSRVYRSVSHLLRSQQKLSCCYPAKHYSERQSCLSFTKRSHLCGDLRAHHVGETVTLCGWLQYHRFKGSFLVLRDWRGLVQLLIPDSKVPECRDLPLESVLEVTGRVQLRPKGQENKDLITGDVEILVEDITVLNTCITNLPFEIKQFNKVGEFLGIKHRYLQLRFPSLQNVLRLRSKFVMSVRQFLANDNGFVEVETPTLFRRTPGGAREFIVPTHIPGKFYSLPQSPQQFKQLLMVGGLDRYFQIARCYRDEGTKPDRQPEFTQIDLEMSFVTQNSVMSLVEEMLEQTWPEECGQVPGPFPRMSYHEAMTKYGSDKPDLRLDWQIVHLDPSYLTSCPPVFQPYMTSKGSTIQILRIPHACKHLSNKDIESVKEAALKGSADKVKLVTYKIKEDGNFNSSLVRHFGNNNEEIKSLLGVEPLDLLFFSAGPNFLPLDADHIIHSCAEIVTEYMGTNLISPSVTREHTVLGQVRLKCAELLISKGVVVREEGLKFLWVDTFPLFLPKEDGGEGLECAHHPFTAPHPEDVDLIFQSPELARSQHYDLVLNGSEIGGGSIRIHNANLQRYILTDVLKHDSSELEHLLEALDSGCPPHGGIALGLDRLMAIMVGVGTIRDVIAFPKITQGRDPLSSSPACVSQSDLDYYHIKLNVDSLKDAQNDPTDDSLKDAQNDPTVDSLKDAQNDPTDDSLKDSQNDLMDDSLKDTQNDPIDDSLKDTQNDPTDDSLKDTQNNPTDKHS